MMYIDKRYTTIVLLHIMYAPKTSGSSWDCEDVGEGNFVLWLDTLVAPVNKETVCACAG